MNANKDAILLRINKEDQVKALQELVFTDVTDKTPLSEIAEYIKWAGGLRDLRITCVKISDGSIHNFIGEDWNAMTANAKSQYSKIGVNIRARKREFIIATADCINPSGGNTFQFGGYGTDFKNVKNYAAGNTGLFDINTGYEDTKAIIEQTAGKTDSQNIAGAPAAEAAWNYKANRYDPMQWYLPSVTELRLLCEYKTEINAFLTKYFSGGTFVSDWYWSSTEYDSSSSCYVSMNYGHSSTNLRHTSSRVRAVCSPVVSSSK
jgi:hypothetical protein